MNSSYVSSVDSSFSLEPDENIMDSIFKQYERVIVESIITSFGLDFLIKDHHGGDVDTIHNVRQFGKDRDMVYKNKANFDNYNNLEKYNSNLYHSDKRYIERNRQIKREKNLGILKDSYTGKSIGINEKSDLDHVISAKEIHYDAGRVLAGLKGVDLANSHDNLQVTNPHTNRTKKASSMNDFLSKRENEYSESEKYNMRKIDAKSRKAYENKLAKEYYTSPRFAKDVACAAGSVGIKTGFKEMLGFVFMEVWFSVKDEFENLANKFSLGELLSRIGNGIKQGVENAKRKYRQLISKFKEGLVSGVLSSITTTICNIFFTTSKNSIKLIRQMYSSVVQAAKVLFINPDNLLLGERIRAVLKILAAGASVIVGTIVSNSVGQAVAFLPSVLKEIVQTFCGTLVTGIMSCTLLYFLDRSKVMNKLVNAINKVHTISTEVDYFRKQAIYFERYAAQLMNLDIDRFSKEVSMYSNLAFKIENAKTESELNAVLKNALNIIGVTIPWKGEFDSFMNDKNTVLVFE